MAATVIILHVKMTTAVAILPDLSVDANHIEGLRPLEQFVQCFPCRLVKSIAKLLACWQFHFSICTCRPEIDWIESTKRLLMVNFILISFQYVLISNCCSSYELLLIFMLLHFSGNNVIRSPNLTPFKQEPVLSTSWSQKLRQRFSSTVIGDFDVHMDRFNGVRLARNSRLGVSFVPSIATICCPFFLEIVQKGNNLRVSSWAPLFIKQTKSFLS